MRLTAIDHVQLAMPEGGEGRARGFYGEILGLPEKAKPPALAARGGVWFETPRLKIHLGVEKDFRPARKAHPALLVEDLPTLAQRLSAAGCPSSMTSPSPATGASIPRTPSATESSCWSRSDPYPRQLPPPP